METLTKENAGSVKQIISKEHPEWGPKEFNYNEQTLSDGSFASTHGIGPNSALLFESEYKFWEVYSWKK